MSSSISRHKKPKSIMWLYVNKRCIAINVLFPFNVIFFTSSWEFNLRSIVSLQNYLNLSKNGNASKLGTTKSNSHKILPECNKVKVNNISSPILQFPKIKWRKTFPNSPILTTIINNPP